MAVMVGFASSSLERSTAEGATVIDHSLDSQDTGSRLLASVIPLMIIMVIVMATRIYCRAFLLRKMGWDDWCMVLAAIFAVCLAICGILGVKAGDGRHRWTVSWEDSVYSKKISYAAQIFYFLSLGFCKASLVFLIIRLTPSEGMMFASWLVLGFCTLFTIASFIASCLQCIPASYLWNQFDPTLRGPIKAVCVNQEALQFALPAINILTDFVVWLLPIKMVWNIHLPPRQKWSLIAVFALGGLGVLAGILRLHAVKVAVGSTEENYLALGMWSDIEVLVSIICGSAPAAKPFFSRYLPGLLGVTSVNSISHSNRPTPGVNSTKLRSRGHHQNSYRLGSISNVTSRLEHGSMEEFGVTGQIMTRVGVSSRDDAGSEEFHSEREVRRDGITKVTDAEVLVEERV